MSNREGELEGTLIGCFVAQLEPSTGRCTHFRQYWFEVEGPVNPFDGWGKEQRDGQGRDEREEPRWLTSPRPPATGWDTCWRTRAASSKCDDPNVEPAEEDP